MIHAERLREAMTKRLLSQSELARRVGVTQTTIRKLVSGTGYGSKYLHRIARELETTPAYLEGETDDPAPEAHSVRQLSSAERELLDCYDALEDHEQKSLLGVAHSMAGRKVRAEPITLPSTAALEDALSGFFEASPGLLGDELVHELAKSFPIILRAASDEIEEVPLDQNDTAPSHQAVPDAVRRAAQPRRRS
jgi:transcriptional regulator with XRE-family HTH domain